MPQEPERRTRHVSIRMTPTEFARLNDAARLSAVELSAYVRRIVVDAPIPKRALHRSVDHVALGRAIAAVNRIGGNMNEIAKIANQTGNLKAFVMAQQERSLLSAATQAVVRAIERLP